MHTLFSLLQKAAITNDLRHHAEVIVLKSKGLIIKEK